MPPSLAKVSFKIRAFLSVMYAHMNQYRAELFLWTLAQCLPFIFLGAWTQAAREGELAFSAAEFTRYFVAVFVVRQFTLVWVIYEFERELLDGSFSHHLLKPIDPLWHHFAEHVSERFARLPFFIGIIVIAVMLLPEAQYLAPFYDFVGALVLTFFAFILRFAIQYAFAMLTFWIEKASALESLWSLAYVFLSGLIAPIALFPPLAQSLVHYTPFPLLINAPATVLMGKAPFSWTPLLLMWAWILGALVVGRVLWWRGLRRHSAMGA